MDPFAFLQYIAFEQLDALAIDGRSRIVDAFRNIDGEAEEYAERMFQSYGEAVGEGDMADFADEAHNQGVAHWQVLDNLRQAMLNLVTIGMYHLYEQGSAELERLSEERSITLPDRSTLAEWATVDELRLVANALKHGEGPAARQLRLRRPELFVAPRFRGTPLGLMAQNRKAITPLGGIDIYVTEADIDIYRDAVRAHWEDLRRHL